MSTPVSRFLSLFFRIESTPGTGLVDLGFVPVHYNWSRSGSRTNQCQPWVFFRNHFCHYVRRAFLRMRPTKENQVGVRSRERKRYRLIWWPCWAPWSDCAWRQIHSRLSSSQSHGEISSLLARLRGLVWLIWKAEVICTSNKGHSAKKAPFWFISNMRHFQRTRPTMDQLPFWNWQNQIHHAWAPGRMLSQSLVSPR